MCIEFFLLAIFIVISSIYRTYYITSQGTPTASASSGDLQGSSTIIGSLQQEVTFSSLSVFQIRFFGQIESTPRDVTTPILLLVVVLIGQQCSGMKIIQGFAVEIFADVFSKVRELKLPTETLKPGNNDTF